MKGNLIQRAGDVFEAISRSKVSGWPSWAGAPVRGVPESYNYVRVDAMREMRIAEEQRIELLYKLLWNKRGQ